LSRRGAGSAARPLLALALGAAALAAWWRFLGGPAVVRALVAMDVRLALLGFLLLGVSQIFRLSRWLVLLRAVGPVTLGQTFRTLFAAELLNTFLPVKLGDAGRALAVSRIAPFTLGSASATIVVDRLSGILVRLAVAPLAILIPFNAPRSLVVSTAVFGGVLVTAVGVGLVLRRRPGLLSVLTGLGLRCVPERLRGPFERTFSSFASSLLTLSLAPAIAVRTFLLSLLALLSQVAAFWLLFRAAGVELEALTVIVGTAYLDLLAVLPAPPAGLGVAEWSVTFVFAWTLGVPGVAVSVTALVSHGMWLLLIVGLGAASSNAIAEMLPRPGKADGR
jgi:uncharacterized protein (TIRG00374 family)